MAIVHGTANHIVPRSRACRKINYNLSCEWWSNQFMQQKHLKQQK